MYSAFNVTDIFEAIYLSKYVKNFSLILSGSMKFRETEEHFQKVIFVKRVFGYLDCFRLQ